MGYVEIEEVESVIDGFDLAHLDEPHLDIFGRSRKDSLPMIIGLADDRAQVLQTLHNANGHLAAIGGLEFKKISFGKITYNEMYIKSIHKISLCFKNFI